MNFSHNPPHKRAHKFLVRFAFDQLSVRMPSSLHDMKLGIGRIGCDLPALTDRGDRIVASVNH